MSDDELPQSAEVASAYLDGGLDATERAAAAADPEVMATVDSFTRVRTALGNVDPVVASTRTAAIAAALAEFDAIQAYGPQTDAPPAAATGTVISLQSRRMRGYRALTGVAAAAIVGVVAIAALNSGVNDDKASTAIATDAPAATELPPELKIAAAETEAAPAATSAASAAGGAVTDSAAAEITDIETTEELEQFAATVEGADATAVAPSETSTAPAPNAAGTAAAPGGYSSTPCLTSDQSVLGPIIFRGVPALAVRDTATGSLQAIAGDDCRVLIDVEAP